MFGLILSESHWFSAINLLMIRLCSTQTRDAFDWIVSAIQVYTQSEIVIAIAKRGFNQSLITIAIAPTNFTLLRVRFEDGLVSEIILHVFIFCFERSDFLGAIRSHGFYNPCRSPVLRVSFQKQNGFDYSRSHSLRSSALRL